MYRNVEYCLAMFLRKLGRGMLYGVIERSWQAPRRSGGLASRIADV
jgi:hypothetical protein